MADNNKNIGSSLDDLLEKTDELSEMVTEAINRVTTWGKICKKNS